MWPVRIADVSGRRPSQAMVFEDEPSLQAWLEQTARQPPRFYDLYMGDGGLRFALGLGVAGGIMESGPGETWWWLREGDPAQPEILVPCDGDVLPVEGSEQVGLARLIEVILAYAQEGERPAGRWIDQHGRAEAPPGTGPWRGPRPRAQGRTTRALVAWIERGPRREQPLQPVLSLLHRVRDENLRAYLYAWAHHHNAEFLKLRDWWPQQPRAEGRDVWLGILASGEPILARSHGQVELRADDGWRRRDFEDFVSQLLSAAREDGEPTSLDE